MPKSDTVMKEAIISFCKENFSNVLPTQLEKNTFSSIVTLIQSKKMSMNDLSLLDEQRFALLALYKENTASLFYELMYTGQLCFSTFQSTQIESLHLLINAFSRNIAGHKLNYSIRHLLYRGILTAEEFFKTPVDEMQFLLLSFELITRNYPMISEWITEGILPFKTTCEYFRSDDAAKKSWEKVNHPLLLLNKQLCASALFSHPNPIYLLRSPFAELIARGRLSLSHFLNLPADLEEQYESTSVFPTLDQSARTILNGPYGILIRMSMMNFLDLDEVLTTVGAPHFDPKSNPAEWSYRLFVLGRLNKLYFFTIPHCLYLLNPVVIAFIEEGYLSLDDFSLLPEQKIKALCDKKNLSRVRLKRATLEQVLYPPTHLVIPARQHGPHFFSSTSTIQPELASEKALLWERFCLHCQIPPETPHLSLDEIHLALVKLTETRLQRQQQRAGSSSHHLIDQARLNQQMAVFLSEKLGIRIELSIKQSDLSLPDRQMTHVPHEAILPILRFRIRLSNESAYLEQDPSRDSKAQTITEIFARYIHDTMGFTQDHAFAFLAVARAGAS